MLRQLDDYGREEAALRSLRTKIYHYIEELNAVARMKIRSIYLRLTVVEKTLINYCHLQFIFFYLIVDLFSVFTVTLACVFDPLHVCTFFVKNKLEKLEKRIKTLFIQSWY